MYIYSAACSAGGVVKPGVNLESPVFLDFGTTVHLATCDNFAESEVFDYADQMPEGGCYDKGAFIGLLVFGIGFTLAISGFIAWQCALDIRRMKAAEEIIVNSGTYTGI